MRSSQWSKSTAFFSEQIWRILSVRIARGWLCGRAKALEWLSRAASPLHLRNRNPWSRQPGPPQSVKHYKRDKKQETLRETLKSDIKEKDDKLNERGLSKEERARLVKERKELEDRLKALGKDKDSEAGWGVARPNKKGAARSHSEKQSPAKTGASGST